jgi:hypothetical protein
MLLEAPLVVALLLLPLLLAAALLPGAAAGLPFASTEVAVGVGCACPLPALPHPRSSVVTPSASGHDA